MPCHRHVYAALLACAAAAGIEALWLAAPARAADEKEKKEKVVIPFDFQAKTVLGEQLGEMVWKKLERQKGFVIPESMKDVRDFCEAKKFKAAPDTPLEVMKRVVKEDFGADVGIWGSVQLAPGQKEEIYDLVVKCVDFSADPPRIVYDKTVRTNSAAEIPHLYVKEMLDALYERKPGEKIVNQFEEQNWKRNPNLVHGGGDFEHGHAGHPDGWDPMNARPEYYRYVKWTTEAGGAANKVIRMDIPKAVAESTGVLYYSEFIKITDGATYRFQVRYRTNGPSPKVFIKGYDLMASEYTAAGKTRVLSAADQKHYGSMRTPHGSLGAKPDDPVLPTEMQYRECYRSQQNLKGPPNVWNVQTEDFTPRHTKYSPKAVRIMLYGYLAEGLIEWDDAVIKEVVPAATTGRPKEKRHSLETKVTLKEMEETERRSEELKARERREKAAAKDKDAQK